jgi:hypothetical protein
MKTLIIIILFSGLLCNKAIADVNNLPDPKDVNKTLDAAKKVLQFAGRNIDDGSKTDNTSTEEEKKSVGTVEKQYVIRNPDQPWLTNEPYLSDAYSNQYAQAKVSHYAQREKYELECFIEKSKGAKKAHIQFWRDKCKQNAIYKLDRLDMPKRGSLDYVKQEYLPFTKLSKGKFGRVIKSTLTDLDELRKKTRLVGGLLSTDIQEGELSYEQVNYEICQIEKIVGKIARKVYCHK